MISKYATAIFLIEFALVVAGLVFQYFIFQEVTREPIAVEVKEVVVTPTPTQEVVEEEATPSPVLKKKIVPVKVSPTVSEVSPDAFGG